MRLGRRVDSVTTRPSLPRAVLVAAASLGLAAPAAGLGISPDPFPFDAFGSNFGEIRLVAVVSGLPSGGSVGDGSVAGTDTTLVLEYVSGPAGAGPSLQIDSTGTMTAIGWIPGPDPDVLAMTLTSSFIAGIDFDVGAISGAGEAYDPFFLSFSSVAPGDTLDFIYNAALNFPGLTIVPEPGTAVLFGSALLAIAARGRKPDQTTRIRNSRRMSASGRSR